MKTVRTTSRTLLKRLTASTLSAVLALSLVPSSALAEAVSDDAEPQAEPVVTEVAEAPQPSDQVVTVIVEAPQVTEEPATAALEEATAAGAVTATDEVTAPEASSTAASEDEVAVPAEGSSIPSEEAAAAPAETEIATVPQTDENPEGAASYTIEVAPPEVGETASDNSSDRYILVKIISVEGGQVLPGPWFEDIPDGGTAGAGAQNINPTRGPIEEDKTYYGVVLLAGCTDINADVNLTGAVLVDKFLYKSIETGQVMGVECWFSATLGKVTIVYDLNGGELDGETGKVSVKVEPGTDVTLPEPTRDGYLFDYWKGSKYNAGDTYTAYANHTFTAQWKEIAEEETTSKGSSSKKSMTSTASWTTPAPVTTAKAALPKTGDNTAAMLGLGALLAGAGLAFVMISLVSRRRKGERA